MIAPETILRLLDRLKTEWALDVAENPDKGNATFCLGLLYGRTQAIELIRGGILDMIKEEEDEDGAGSS